MPLGPELSIGQVAKRSGLAVSAIRFYQARGLIHANRNAGGHRRYNRAVIRRLAFIQIAQQFGFTLDEISQELATLPAERAPTAQEWAEIGQGFRDALTRQIETLTMLRDNLDGCIGCGCLSLETCALYNPKDAAHIKGAGPRFLLGDKASDIPKQ